jgi:molecular chaperone GrpE
MSESKADTPESEPETGEHQGGEATAGEHQGGEAPAGEHQGGEHQGGEHQGGEATAGESRAEDAGIPSAPAGEGDRIALLEAEISQLKDQLLRALAETENVRRRGQRERSDAIKYGAASLVKDLLAVSDNLRRAIDSVPREAAAEDDRLLTLLDGVELTEKELLSVFERHHIVKLEPLGEKLDPHRHEAMYEVPDPSQPPGTVVQVIEPGYLLHDRLVRPARVGIAKGQATEPPAD